jgi:hypothetical protein
LCRHIATTLGSAIDVCNESGVGVKRVVDVDDDRV